MSDPREMAHGLYVVFGGCCLHFMLEDGNLEDFRFESTDGRFTDCRSGEGDPNEWCMPVYEWLKGLDERTRYAWYYGRWERLDYEQADGEMLDDVGPPVSVKDGATVSLSGPATITGLGVGARLEINGWPVAYAEGARLGAGSLITNHGVAVFYGPDADKGKGP